MYRFYAAMGIALAIAACGPPGPIPRARGEQLSEHAHSAASVEGEVLGVDHVPPADHLASGFRARLQPSQGQPIVVDLAPDWFLDRHGLRVIPQRRIRVEGRYVAQDGGSVLFVQRIEESGNAVELRTRQGAPLWR